MGVVFSALNILAGIGAIYIVIGFGLLDIAGWAFGRLQDQLVHIATLVSRTLPLLLILVVFLMFSAELWEAAHALHAQELAAVLGLLLVVGSILVVTTFRPEVRARASRRRSTGTRFVARRPTRRPPRWPSAPSRPDFRSRD